MVVPATTILGLVTALGLLFGVATTALAVAPCDQGGPCTCGELYNIDRCTGIGVNSCGCGAGFTGPSLGPTFDCGHHPMGGCCLPTGQTYATACLGRVDGTACTSSSQCASGGCVNGVCGPGGTTAEAPALSGITPVLVVVAALLGQAWWWRRRSTARGV